MHRQLFYHLEKTVFFLYFPLARLPQAAQRCELHRLKDGFQIPANVFSSKDRFRWRLFQRVFHPQLF